jgi:3-hydroxyisobutyrate dehydrogenase-like beta-hydroxyacid dehydrogenase
VKPSVGFIGLGSQGLGMALRIERAGFPLTVWARRAQTLEPFRGTRARAASSPRELGAASELVCICVVNDADVEQVLLGDAGALAGMAPGGLIALHSTVHPGLPARIAELAEPRGVRVVDAPVSGGGQVALEGKLKTIVGAAAEDLERVRPVFESYSDRVFHVGGLGSGQICKLINNALMTAHLQLARDAERLAGQLGLDPKAFLEVASVSSGSSFSLQALARVPFFAQSEAGTAARRALGNLIKDEAILAELVRERRADAGELSRVAKAGADLLAR